MPCLSVLCVQNVSELKQHLLDVWYGIEQNIIDSAIKVAHEFCVSIVLRLKGEILSK